MRARVHHTHTHTVEVVSDLYLLDTHTLIWTHIPADAAHGESPPPLQAAGAASGGGGEVYIFGGSDADGMEFTPSAVNNVSSLHLQL